MITIHSTPEAYYPLTASELPVGRIGEIKPGFFIGGINTKQYTHVLRTCEGLLFLPGCHHSTKQDYYDPASDRPFGPPCRIVDATVIFEK